MSRERKILFPLCIFLACLPAGVIRPTGEELAGLGVFLAGFAGLYWVLMRGW